MSDPRVYFAAERTMLAWIRSGLTIIAMGFVVERFGLFLDLLPRPAGLSSVQGGHRLSDLIGVVLVVIGVAAILGALRNHRRYVAAIPPEDMPAAAMPGLVGWLAWLVAAAGVLLALYLVVV